MVGMLTPEMASKVDILSVSAVAELVEARPGSFAEIFLNPDTQQAQFDAANLAAQGAGSFTTAYTQQRDQDAEAREQRRRDADAIQTISVTQNNVSGFLDNNFGLAIDEALSKFLLAKTTAERARLYNELMDEVIPELREQYPDSSEEELEELARQHIEDVYAAKLEEELGLSPEDARARAQEELQDVAKYNEIAAELEATYANNPELKSLIMSFEEENAELARIESEIDAITENMNAMADMAASGGHFSNGSYMMMLNARNELEEQLKEQSTRVEELEAQLNALPEDNIVHAYLEANTEKASEQVDALKKKQAALDELLGIKEELVNEGASQISSETYTEEEIKARIEESAITQSCAAPKAQFNLATFGLPGSENDMTAGMDDDFRTRLQIDSYAAGEAGKKILSTDEEIQATQAEIGALENPTEQDADSEQNEALTLESPTIEEIGRYDKLSNDARNYADQLRYSPSASLSDLEGYFGELTDKERELVVARLEAAGIDIVDDLTPETEVEPAVEAELDTSPEPTTPAPKTEEYRYAQSTGPGMSVGMGSIG